MGPEDEEFFETYCDSIDDDNQEEDYDQWN